METNHRFHVLDYIVFALTILISLGIGVYFAVAGRKQATSGEYLMGGRTMKVLPVAMSILVSVLSTIGLLGVPAEVYLYGTQFMLTSVAHALGTVLGVIFFVPIFYRLKLTSTFEYQALRYQTRLMEVVCASISLFHVTLYNAIMIFSPCVAFEAVSGVPVWVSMIVTGLSTVLYTSIGGIKAVVWTDVFQSVLIFVGLIAVVTLGTVKTGGAAEVWRINQEWGHIHFFNFDPDPTTRLTFWNVVIVNSILWMMLSTTQSSVQRYCALKGLAEARKSMCITILGFSIAGTLNGVAGITAFAYYAKQGCDPVLSGKLQNPNQIMPYFVMDVINYPAVPGIYIACLFSASLSSLSSGLNGAAAVAWQNILRHRYGHLPDTTQAKICKVTTLVFGLLSIAFGLLVKAAGGTLIQVAYSVLGAIGGPLLGIIVIGALWPRASSRGTLIALVLSIIFSLWICVGANFHRQSRDPPLGGPTDRCFIPSNDTFQYSNSSLDSIPIAIDSAWPRTTMSSDLGSNASVSLGWNGSSLETQDSLSPAVRWFYSVSYFYYPLIGIFNVTIISFVLSFIPANMETNHRFHVLDYIVFALTILISLGIGVYFAVAGRKQATSGEYLMGGRTMKVLPVAMSILVSVLSTIGLLGVPAEVYLYGTQFMLTSVAHALGTVLGVIFFVPIFYRLKLTSTFEYQALRYQTRLMEVVCASISLFHVTLYNAIMIFSPCVAFEAVSGVPVWVSMIVTGLSTVLYTSIGGIKAVVWTDVFQSVLIFVGLIAVVTLGTVKTGGAAEVWRINQEWGHIHFFNFDPDPTTRLTFWNVVIVNSILWMMLSTTQSSVQRYCALKGLAEARKSMCITILGFSIAGTLNGVAGITAFAYYAKQGCDPVLSGKLQNPNQIMPYFVMDVMNYPAVPGIYIACLFSASLSSLSSGLNGAAAVAWQNILRHRYGHLPDTTQAKICKVTTLVFGLLSIAFGFLVKAAGGILIQVAYSVLGAIGGPLLGTIVIGALWPRASSRELKDLSGNKDQPLKHWKPANATESPWERREKEPLNPDSDYHIKEKC